MPVNSYIRDGEGSGHVAGVTSDNAIKVSIVETSANSVPIPQLIRQKQLRVFFTDSAGSVDLNIDGSVSPVEFQVASEDISTKWLFAIRLLFHGTNFEIGTNDFRRFGAATAINTPLTNGVKLFVEQEGIITNLVAEPVKCTGDFLSYADSFVNLVNSVSSQEDFLSFDMTFDVPIVIPPGTADKLVCEISDDLTALTLFQIVARGYQEIREPA